MAALVAGRKGCFGCHASTFVDELFTPTLLQGRWVVVPAADTSRHALCAVCAIRRIGVDLEEYR